ncbi:MAG: VCBS repeat-containing protein [Krumholzibacteria bacterium]|nr:VCBS repeat-containing protein [Candidatus Krumholzibacteria bacterium]
MTARSAKLMRLTAIAVVSALLFICPKQLQAQVPDAEFPYHDYGIRVYTHDWSDISAQAALGDAFIDLANRRISIICEDLRTSAADILSLTSADIKLLTNNNMTGCKYPWHGVSWQHACLHEYSFLHSADPASVSVFATASGIHVRWLPDRRYDWQETYEPQYPTPLTHFRIYRAEGANVPGVFQLVYESQTSNRFIDTAVVPGSRYWYLVRTVHGSSELEYSGSESTVETIHNAIYNPAQLPAAGYWVARLEEVSNISGTDSLYVTLGILLNEGSVPTVAANIKVPGGALGDASFSYAWQLDYPVEDPANPGTYYARGVGVFTPTPGANNAYAVRFLVDHGSGATVLWPGQYNSTAPNNRLASSLWKNFRMNPWHPEAFAAWAAETNHVLNAVPGGVYDGIFGDSADLGVWNTNTLPFIATPGNPEVNSFSQSAYGEAVVDFVRAARASLNGGLLALNGVLAEFYESPSAADMFARENFVFDASFVSTTPGEETDGMVSGSCWVNQMHDLNDALLDSGEGQVIGLTEATASTERGRIFSLASVLALGERERVFVGQHFQFTAEGMDYYFPEYQITVGPPVSPLVLPPPGGDIWRVPADFVPDKAAPDAVDCDLQPTQDEPGMVPLTREFEFGAVAINFRENRYIHEYGLPEYRITFDPIAVFGAEHDYYLVRTDDKILSNGGRLWTEPVTGPIEIINAHAAIFVFEPISSPEVTDHALYGVYSDPGLGSRLVVQAASWNGEPLWVEVDASSISGDGKIVLQDTGSGYDDYAGDGLYSSVPLTLTAESGTYQLPIYARGDDGLGYYGLLTVDVDPVYPIVAHRAAVTRDTEFAFSVAVTSASGQGIATVTADLSVLDSSLGTSEELMDDGTGGDLVARDGLWSRALTIGTPDEVHVHVVARDSLANTASADVAFHLAHTPGVGTTGKYAIAGSPKYTSTVAVDASHWNGGDLAIDVDCSALNGDEDLRLLPPSETEDAYARRVVNVSAADGTYQLPFRAVGTDGAMLLGRFEVTVSGDSTQNFKDYSDSNMVSVLKTAITSKPLSIMPLNADGGAVMDLLVSQEGATGKYFNAEDNDRFVPNFFNDTVDRFVSQSDHVRAGASSCAAADYDTMGHEGFFACSEDGFRLYRLSEVAGNKYVDDTAASISDLPDTAFAAAWYDYTRDGFVDLAIAGTDGTGDGIYFYRNRQGVLEFVEKESLDLGQGVRNFSAPYPMLWADLDLGDGGEVELIVGAEVAGVPTLRAYARAATFNTPLLRYEIGDASNDVFPDGAPTYVTRAVLADVDSDGDQDLVVARAGESAAGDKLMIYRYTAGQLRPVAGVPGATFADSLASVLVADMDPDGKPDIIAVPAGQTAPRLLLNSSSTDIAFVEESTTLAVGAATGGLAYDWLGGKPNLYLAKAPVGGAVENFFYGYEPAPGVSLGKTVRVRVGETDVMNSSGIGTRIEVEWDGKHAYQWFNGGGGRGEQQPRELVFSLGHVTGMVIYVRALWPDGIVTELYAHKQAADLFLVERSSPAVIYEESVSAGFLIDPGGHHWYRFEWDADRQAIPEVTFWFADAQPECRCGVADSVLTLTPETPGVGLSFSQTGEDSFHYEMIWGDRCCPGIRCTFRYRVRCRLNGVVTESETNEFMSPRYCPSN